LMLLLLQVAAHCYNMLQVSASFRRLQAAAGCRLLQAAAAG